MLRKNILHVLITLALVYLGLNYLSLYNSNLDQGQLLLFTLTGVLYSFVIIFIIYELINYRVFRRLDYLKKDLLYLKGKDSLKPISDDEIGQLEHAINDLINTMEYCQRESNFQKQVYESIVEDMPILICRYKSDGSITFANHFFKQLIQAENINSIIDPKYLSKTKYSYLSLSVDKPVSVIENEIIDKYGQRKWIEWTNVGFFDKNNLLTEYQSIGVNISERKEIERKLIENDTQLKLITDNMLDIVTQTDLEGKFVYISPSYQKTLGWMPDIGDSIYDCVHPDDISTLKEGFLKAVKREKINKAEFRARHINNSYVWLEVIGDMLYDEDKNLIGTILSSRDVTTKKFYQEKLDFQFKLQELISEISTDLVRAYNHDTDQEIINALSRVGIFLNVDRAFIYLFDGEEMYSKHNWAKPGVVWDETRNAKTRADVFPWALDKMKRYEIISINTINIPEEGVNEKKLLVSQGTTSVLLIPMRLNGSLLGYLGLESLTQRHWKEDTINMLTILNRLIGSILRETMDSYKVGG